MDRQREDSLDNEARDSFAVPAGSSCSLGTIHDQTGELQEAARSSRTTAGAEKPCLPQRCIALCGLSCIARGVGHTQ